LLHGELAETLEDSNTTSSEYDQQAVERQACHEEVGGLDTSSESNTLDTINEEGARACHDIRALHQGACELPSDIAGITFIDVTHGVEAAGENIRKEVTAALNLVD